MTTEFLQLLRRAPVLHSQRSPLPLRPIRLAVLAALSLDRRRSCMARVA
jgi:hypothetical protein